jgi:hypothetical protein
MGEWSYRSTFLELGAKLNLVKLTVLIGSAAQVSMGCIDISCYHRVILIRYFSELFMMCRVKSVEPIHGILSESLLLFFKNIHRFS